MRSTMVTVEPRAASLPCRLGFHHWVAGVNDLGEHCFVCPRCGRIDPNNDTNIATYAMAYGFGGRQPLPHWWSTPR